ncbi:Homeodomain-like protein [Cynara cardunculus var. scolymus]|uniref:Homeodomain-like protein n=1 Tax=Cynara cardunculus var. scolymus TaxID=59895 RepID=A0A103Y2N1_CYNCS|nr:Homeodomain-like protein [Cynara cardunculus var. scolymus]
MTGAETKEAPENIGKLVHLQSSTPKSYAKRSRKLKPHGNTLSSPMSKKKLVDLLTNSKKKEFKRRNASNKASKSLSKPSLVSCQNQKKQLAATGSNENEKCEKGDPTSEKFKQRRKRKRTNNKVEVDEASRLQRRTRYLLIKMKIEQNLLDAYSTEGWKGQSREKIKPEKELQRAKKQILKCKLGIRDALRQLDLLSSDGCIDESVIAPDGSVHHEHIHCAKCKLRDAFPDNDIILCDGTCNCAFHQMCIDPPLLTENIPPGDQGWFCKYCICKTEIMEAMNAHLGTSYPHDSNWQEIFKVEATLPDGGNTLLNQEEWPSDDSGDDDYDPDRVEKRDSSCSRVCSEGESCDDDASSSYSLQSLDVKALDDESQKLDMGLESISADLIGAVSGSGSDCEFVSGRRQRQAVDYRKLYDEMFGKDALANEQASEDEDWGPTNRKRREKESDAASTLMTLCETEEKSVKDVPDTSKVDTNLSCKETKRSFFRIPSEAVEKLRLVFAKNELPSRAVKEDLSKQLGLDLEKAGEENPTQNDGISISKESGSEPAKNEAIDEILSEDMPTTLAHTPGNGHMKKFRRRKNPQSPTSTAKQQQVEREFNLTTSTNKVDGNEDLGDDDLSLKMLRENVKKEKIRAVDIGGSSEGDDQQAVAAAESQMEKLCFLKTKMEKLKQVLLLRTPNRRAKTTATSIDHTNTIFVPVAHLKEKH